jgi:hypothetical protein
MVEDEAPTAHAGPEEPTKPPRPVAKSRWTRLANAAIDNPLALSGLIALVLYIGLRLPADRFYGQFNATPDDAGIGAVDLLIRQSARVLIVATVFGILFFAIPVALTVWLWKHRRQGPAGATGPRGTSGARGPQGAPSWAHRGLLEAVSGALWWVMFVVFAVALEFATLFLVIFTVATTSNAAFVLACFMMWLVSFGYLLWKTDDDAQLVNWFARSNWLVGVLLGAFYGVLVFSVAAYVQAKKDADGVKNGSYEIQKIFPWQARAVQAVWKPDSPRTALPTACGDLVYLGETSDQVLIYDRPGNRTLRIPTTDVTLIFPDSCAAPPAPVAPDHAGG